MRFVDGIKRLLGGSAATAYDLERAVVVVFANLPETGRQALDHDDIEVVLKQAMRYQEEQGLMDRRRVAPGTDAPILDNSAMAAFVQEKARLREKELSLEDIHAVFEAELVYLSRLGLID